MRIIKIIIPCLLLGACMFGTSKTAKFYTMPVSQVEPVCEDYAAFVGVNRVQLPKYIDRPQMVMQHDGYAQVSISEYNRWVELPTIMVTRVLTENLSRLLPAAQVKQNQFKKEGFNQILAVEIIKMNAMLGEKAELTAWYTIKDASGTTQTRREFSSSVQIGKTYDELAQGYSQLLTNLSQEIAASLIKK